MKIKKFVTISILFALVALVGGCHYDNDDHRDYGNNRYNNRYGTYRDGNGTYREGYRDGRAAERRRDAWLDSRYEDRRDEWRRRW